MKTMMWIVSSVCLSACATGPSSDSPEASPATSELSAPVILPVRPDVGQAEIEAQAIAASTPACHGTTSCAGTVLNPTPIVIDCGPHTCGGPACPARNPTHTQLVQPREHYVSYSVGGNVCLAYAPSPSRVLVPAQCGLACEL